MNLKVAKEAYQEVEFYKKKKLHFKKDNNESDDFFDLPLLEKNEIVGNTLDLIAPQYLLGLYRDEYLCTNTSGSMGKCLEIYWKRSDYMRSMFSLWFYRRKFYGINTWDKKCQFFTLLQVGEKEPKSIIKGNNLGFSKCNLTEEGLTEIYNEMLKFEPVWLLLQPCVAELLCIVKRKKNLPQINSLRYIELTGEWLTDSLKKKIKKEFRCTVANQYGANEVNSIAYECPEGNLHVMEDNVFVEILGDDGRQKNIGEEGDVYVTTLHNRVMPFIRYKIGERAILYENDCCCGHKGRIMDLCTGRCNDWVFQANGQKVTPYVFVRAIDVVNIIYDNCILQYQITQTAYDSFIVNLVVDEYSEGICECFIQNLGHDELKKCKYTFHFIDQLFPEKNGKRRFFRNDIPYNEQKITQ